MDSQRCESLNFQLGGYYENSFLELDANLQSRVRKAFFPEWDSLSAEQRRAFAINYDYQHDPKLEPVLYFELIQFMDELSVMEARARKESKDAAALVIVDIATRIKSLLDTDRETVGREIQESRSKVASLGAASSYATDLMNILNLAVNEFFNPRKILDPKKEEVTEWIKSKGKQLNIIVSDNVADTIFTIIKPNDHNPKIKRVDPLA